MQCDVLWTNENSNDDPGKFGLFLNTEKHYLRAEEEDV